MIPHVGGIFCWSPHRIQCLLGWCTWTWSPRWSRPMVSPGAYFWVLTPWMELPNIIVDGGGWPLLMYYDLWGWIRRWERVPSGRCNWCGFRCWGPLLFIRGGGCSGMAIRAAGWMRDCIFDWFLWGALVCRKLWTIGVCTYRLILRCLTALTRSLVRSSWRS